MIRRVLPNQNHPQRDRNPAKGVRGGMCRQRSATQPGFLVSIQPSFHLLENFHHPGTGFSWTTNFESGQKRIVRASCFRDGWHSDSDEKILRLSTTDKVCSAPPHPSENIRANMHTTETPIPTLSTNPPRHHYHLDRNPTFSTISTTLSLSEDFTPLPVSEIPSPLILIAAIPAIIFGAFCTNLVSETPVPVAASLLGWITQCFFLGHVSEYYEFPFRWMQV